MLFSDLLKEKNVSRETIEKLELYNSLLKKWNSAYNLVNENTLTDSLQRHFLDSIQLYTFLEPKENLIDVGSGAGFPGMVLAIMGISDVTLVESNRKKCLFMQEVSRQTAARVKILNERIETVSEKYDQITARAFSSLSELLKIVKNVSRETSSKGYFLKGEKWQQEIHSCQKEGWNFRYESISSTTQKNAAIIKVWDINKK